MLLKKFMRCISVVIGGRRWTEDLAQILGRVTSALGVTGQVEAALYKLLVYDTGSFFLSHRDSEKAPGMFATLVVVLPSIYTGGELLIRHKGRTVRLDLRHDEPSEVAYAAFYADCRHEVLPVVSGYRLALVYNLLRVGDGPPPQPPDYAPQQHQATELLSAWGEGDPSPAAGPSKLIYPLPPGACLHPGGPRLRVPEGGRCRGRRRPDGGRAGRGLRPPSRPGQYRGKRLGRVCRGWALERPRVRDWGGGG